MRLYPNQDNTEALRIRRKQRRVKRNPQPRDFKTLKEYIEAGGRLRQRKGQKRTNLTPLEHTEQANLVKMVLLYRARIPALKRFFAIPNAGAARLRNLQTEGVLRGVYDCMLAHSMGDVHGLFIELKRLKGGKLSAEQIEFGAEMDLAGYATAVCKGAEAAWLTILEYLGEKDPR